MVVVVEVVVVVVVVVDVVVVDVLGYLSNPQEAANLCDEAYRNRMANAICDGIEAFLETRQAQ